MTNLLRSCGAAIVALLFLSGAIFNYGQAPSASQTTQTPRPDHVILISVDGMPPDYYTAPEKLGLRVPTLTMMGRLGERLSQPPNALSNLTFA